MLPEFVRVILRECQQNVGDEIELKIKRVFEKTRFFVLHDELDGNYSSLLKLNFKITKFTSTPKVALNFFVSSTSPIP